MIRFVCNAALAAVPLHFSNQVMETVEKDGVAAGLIHLIFCLVFIEVVVEIVKGWLE